MLWFTRVVIIIKLNSGISFGLFVYSYIYFLAIWKNGGEKFSVVFAFFLDWHTSWKAQEDVRKWSMCVLICMCPAIIMTVVCQERKKGEKVVHKLCTASSSASAATTEIKRKNRRTAHIEMDEKDGAVTRRNTNVSRSVYFSGMDGTKKKTGAEKKRKKMNVRICVS